jgi:hypothetical protein
VDEAYDPSPSRFQRPVKPGGLIPSLAPMEVLTDKNGADR